ncbi:hypothetical protein AGDE_14082 [Angomonas deanei]|uniref:Palmitoyltransferase n=1 Tax=Angomonas deanei TaxID=59799 RepID=A0A7G2CLS9_9TRYP|nr:hypothetical protein AGDE_14082 [Angomonas deanei]CAD2220800.1 DHHC palmitoyltransferase, putative [Angomonas deanei]|eukprot:EPY21450.1 hypothetical protein AGDE_14082 [Angomonas deanei]
MDHHCVYLNNCISNRNYKYFFLLLAYSTVCGVLGVVSLCVVLFGLFPAEALWRRKSWFLEVLAFFLYVLFVAYLLQYHVMLLWSGRTTIAHLGDKTRETFMIQQGFPHKSSVRDRCAAHFTGDSLLLVEGGARRGGSRQARWREVFGVGGPVWYHLLPLSPRRSEGGSKAQST